MLPLRLIILACAAMLAVPSQAALWSTAYYPGWTQGYLRATNIDFSALTHVIHFAVVPNSNGTLDSSVNVVTPANSASIITNARAAGVKVLICVGGAGAQAGFQSASGPSYRAAFVSNLVQFATSRGYDGIDVDWEPLLPADESNFTNFIISLRAALNATNSQLLLTAAAATEPGFYASVQSRFNQINIMTYDLSGPWPGWITWFNSPVYDGGTRFASTGQLVPSIDGMVTNFVAHGIALAKLGIGVPFYGYVWSGGSGTSTGGASLPRQSWSSAPTVAAYPYSFIITNLYQPSRYVWDTNAQVPYLTIDNSGSSNDKFVSYDDETSVRAKVRYAREKKLGGVMIWELSQGWRAEQPSGQRDPLLKAIKAELAKGFVIFGTQRLSNQIMFQFSSTPGRGYEVQAAGRLPTTNWQLLTNITATNQSTTLYQPISPTNNAFYRIASP